MRLSACRRVLVSLVLIVAPAPALAQAAASPRKANVISINPLLLAFGGVSAEYERRIGNASALAAGFNYYSPELFDYISADAKFRFYPNGEALRGFSVAGTGGVTHASESLDVDCFDCQEESGTALTLGVELNYQWLLGSTRNFAVTLGLGAKRLFFVGGSVGDAAVGLPTARLSIGYAF